MAELGTLVTVVTADISGFSQNMEEAGQKSEQFKKKVEFSISGINEKLNDFKRHMRGFNEILSLGFGVEIGRKVFEQIHEGIVEFSSATIEAAKSGMSFAESLEDGARAAVGMKTKLEELTEAKKRNMEVFKQAAAGEEKIFGGGGLGAAGAEFLRTTEAAQPGRLEVADIRERLRLAQEGLPETVRALQSELAAAENKWAAIFLAEENAARTLREMTAEMEKQNEERSEFERHSREIDMIRAKEAEQIERQQKKQKEMEEAATKAKKAREEAQEKELENTVSLTEKLSKIGGSLATDLIEELKKKKPKEAHTGTLADLQQSLQEAAVGEKKATKELQIEQHRTAVDSKTLLKNIDKSLIEANSMNQFEFAA